MYRLTYPREKFDEEKINKTEILQLIRKHIDIATNIKKTKSYYEGQHAILNRKKKSKKASNNKVVCNHAKDISDTATGYFLSGAITYSSNEEKIDLDRLTDAFDYANVDDVDQDNGLEMSRCGVAFEYVYAKENESNVLSKNIESESTFMVYDDTIEQNELFGVYYYARTDDATNKVKYMVTVMTQNFIYTLNIIDDLELKQKGFENKEKHFFKEIPLIVYQNNKDCNGDYEQQISLIDAYNILMSDRINDKEQFVEALLVLYGANLADDTETTAEALKVLKEMGLLEMPADAKAEYLSRAFDEASVEVLRNAIKEDIYTFSHVPNITDQNFVGNSSGVAMEYKLLGLHMITKTKSRYYTKGLKKRIRLYCNYLGMKNVSINASSIVPVFTRSLPKNLLELSQMISNLKGTVSQKTLISQLDFVEDPDGEIESVKKENEEAVKKQQEMFASNTNTLPPEEEVDE